MSQFYKQILWKENSRYAIIIEDDGKVAYAYLMLDNKIIGDVWLYNQAPTPQLTTWKEGDMPFLNPEEFVRENIRPIIDEDSIEIEWIRLKGSQPDKVEIFIERKLIASISSGSNPGWSTLVKKDGPLAKLLKV